MFGRNYPEQDRRCFLLLLSVRGWGTGEEITSLFYLDMLISGMTPALISICEQRHNTPLPLLFPSSEKQPTPLIFIPLSRFVNHQTSVCPVKINDLLSFNTNYIYFFVCCSLLICVNKTNPAVNWSCAQCCHAAIVAKSEIKCKWSLHCFGHICHWLATV